MTNPTPKPNHSATGLATAAAIQTGAALQAAARKAQNIGKTLNLPHPKAYRHPELCSRLVTGCTLAHDPENPDTEVHEIRAFDDLNMIDYLITIEDETGEIIEIADKFSGSRYCDFMEDEPERLEDARRGLIDDAASALALANLIATHQRSGKYVTIQQITGINTVEDARQYAKATALADANVRAAIVRHLTDAIDALDNLYDLRDRTAEKQPSGDTAETTPADTAKK